ncbi:MAG: glycosyltransferase family 1 protein [Candidatus Coatesbacteria bacterium]|nr:glycosyltransferase family 1 protein [Candidatus Coatesbacteria bacterium]
MRVLLLSNTLGRWGDINGVEYTYNSLLPHFRKSGIQVDCVTYGPTESYFTDGIVSIRTHKPLWPVRIDPTLRIDPALLLDMNLHFTNLAREIYSKDYDVVHTATPDPLGMIGNRLAKERGTPLVGAYHTAVDKYARIRVGKALGSNAGRMAGFVVNRFLKSYYNEADLVIVPSHYVKDELSKELKTRVEVLTHGIDTYLFSPEKRERNDGKVQALYVGRVAPEKNMQLLTAIFSKRRDVELKVVGDGPYLQEMKRVAPDATYTGMLTGEALYRAFADADFFVFPSRTDTFGNVVLQALGSGLPVVVTDGMAPKEQIQHGVTGFVANDDNDFLRFVDTLVWSPALRQKMGLAARAYAEGETWGSVFETLLTQYELAAKLQKDRRRDPRRDYSPIPMFGTDYSPLDIHPYWPTAGR